MRYYYYGRNSEPPENGWDRQHTEGKRRLSQQEIDRQLEDADELVIEDNTVYEIDRECIRCRQKAGR